MTLTRREKFLIIFGLILVSVALYVFYFIIPYLKDTSDTMARYASAQSQLNVLNAKASGVKKVNAEIAELENSLKSRGATIPDGLDHARILLYLEKLTLGKAENVTVVVTGESSVENGLLTQHVTVEFNSTWTAMQEILEELKTNALYNRVTFLSADYVPQSLPVAPQATGESDTPAATATPQANANVITAHVELLFFAFQPEDGKPMEPPLTPANTGRTNSLFPDR
jgi:hypothetical protein